MGVYLGFRSRNRSWTKRYKIYLFNISKIDYTFGIKTRRIGSITIILPGFSYLIFNQNILIIPDYIRSYHFLITLQ
jgi:hypothetical protein